MTWNQNAPGLPLIPAAARSDVPVGVGLDIEPHSEGRQGTFTAPWNITITPLDTCGLVTLTGDKYRRVRYSQDHIGADILANYQLWAADEADQRGHELEIPRRV
jgi:hypothetical protein